MREKKKVKRSLNANNSEKSARCGVHVEKGVHVGLWSLRQLSWGLLKICSNFYAACGMANPIKASHLLTDETLLFFTYLSKIFL